MSEQGAPNARASKSDKPPRTFLRVVQHSNVLYWWPVWLYGYVCAGLTYAQGVAVPQLAAIPGKTILFHPSPMLGWSFVCVVLSIVYLSNVRSRGIYSLIALAAMILSYYFVPKMPGYGVVSEWFGLLRIHLNLAFYVTFSSMLLALWLLMFLLIDRFAWVRVTPGQVAEEHLIGQATGLVFSSEGLVVKRLPNDLFRHSILGLGWLNIGTGDILLRPPTGESLELLNVWRANFKQSEIERLLATKVTTQSAPLK